MIIIYYIKTESKYSDQVCASTQSNVISSCFCYWNIFLVSTAKSTFFMLCQAVESNTSVSQESILTGVLKKIITSTKFWKNGWESKYIHACIYALSIFLTKSTYMNISNVEQ